ncbi:hypothetical protein AGMMS49992_07240 [Clostridia bacterium]|nr:hypothetical protein AGMMS49992_07240 [Clostridia bacterium]
MPDTDGSNGSNPRAEPHSIALYRQWRSKRFQDQVGQEAVTSALRAQVRDATFTHAYLFSGPRGTGKTSTARIFARAINCLQPDDGEPCGHCAVCEALAREDAMDVLEIDAASNTQVEHMRDILDRVMYPPVTARRRVYIIDEVHMLSRHAFNALLKTLEEPPGHIVFILATTEPNKLPETILSRCQWYAFHRIEPRLIVDRLALVAQTHGIPVEEGALWLIARAAEGGMRDALSLLDVCRATNTGTITEDHVRTVLGAADPAALFSLTDTCARKDAGAALRIVNDAFLQGLDPQEFAQNLAEHVRALLMAQSVGDELPRMLAVTSETAERYRAQAGQFKLDNLLRLLDLFAASAQTNKWNANPRMTLEAALLRACLPDDALRLDELAARVDALERQLAGVKIEAVPSITPTVVTTVIHNAIPDKAPAIIPAAAAVAAPATPSPSADPKKLWTKTVDLIMRAKPGLMAQLRQGQFAGVADGAATIRFDADKTIHADYVKSPANVTAIESALEQAFGVKLRLNVESSAAVTAVAPKPDIQQQVFNLFSRENVEVLEDDAPF